MRGYMTKQRKAGKIKHWRVYKKEKELLINEARTNT